MKIALVIVNKTTFNASFRAIDVKSQSEAESLIRKDYNPDTDKVDVIPPTLVSELIAELRKVAEQRY